MSYVDHLECGRCRTPYRKGEVHGLCRCGAPLLVRYDLAPPRAGFGRERLPERVRSMWRYAEMLPVERPENVVTLGEGFTPIVETRRLGRRLGLERLYIKDESSNPTGSF